MGICSRTGEKAKPERHSEQSEESRYIAASRQFGMLRYAQHNSLLDYMVRSST
jgi:hypothetical protein